MAPERVVPRGTASDGNAEDGMQRDRIHAEMRARELTASDWRLPG